MFQISNWLTNVLINVNCIMFQISNWLTNVIINVNFIMFQISQLNVPRYFYFAYKSNNQHKLLFDFDM